MRLRTWSKDDISRGSKVLLRLDVNVPVLRGSAGDSGPKGRIAQALPEINRLRRRGARIIIAAHRGDPHGHADRRLSLTPMARALSTELATSVTLIQNFAVPEMKNGEVCLLENLRFHPGEEMNDDHFAAKLAALAQIYVNNAFGVCHRRHASVHAITRHLPSFAGELLEREVAELLRPARRPYVLLLGGVKIATKLPLLENLGRKVDKILLGGGLAITCLMASEVELPVYPANLMEEPDLVAARKILRKWGRKILLPLDVVAAPRRQVITDIGPKTIEAYKLVLSQAKEVLWNGPLGIIERRDGQAATRSLARAITHQKNLRSVTGGGETVDMLEKEHLAHKFSHVSTGGGAMLALLSGNRLPGLDALRN